MKALKTFDEEDPYYFLRKHLLSKAIFRPDEEFTTKKRYYISS
jgi:hypothetical protein